MKRSELLPNFWHLPLAMVVLGLNSCGQPAISGDPSATRIVPSAHSVSGESAMQPVQPTDESQTRDSVEWANAEQFSESTSATEHDEDVTMSEVNEVTGPVRQDPRRSDPDDPPPAHSSQGPPTSGATGSGATATLADHEPLFVGWPQPKLALVFTGARMDIWNHADVRGWRIKKVEWCAAIR